MSENKIDTFYPKSKEDWRNWLEEHHNRKKSIWLIMYKKKSKTPSISWSEAVDEALCFGWIDSLKKTIDENSYRQFFCPRKVKSNWSKINKEKIELLILAGQMTPAGMESVRIAKENGSWTILDSVEALIIPNDLKLAFKNNQVAKDFYSNLSKSKKKILLHWLMSAKRTQTREKRLNEIFENAEKGLLPKAFRVD